MIRYLRAAEKYLARLELYVEDTYLDGLEDQIDYIARNNTNGVRLGREEKKRPGVYKSRFEYTWIFHRPEPNGDTTIVHLNDTRMRRGGRLP